MKNLKYAEKTVMVSFRCPESKVKEFRKIGNSQLAKWKAKMSTNDIKISDIDRHQYESRKYNISILRKNTHISRIANGAKGKFNVLLAQDILGILCEVKFIDGDTLNCERENIKPVSRDVEYLY